MWQTFSNLIFSNGMNFVLFVEIIELILICKELFTNRKIWMQFVLFDIHYVLFAMF